MLEGRAWLVVAAAMGAFSPATTLAQVDESHEAQARALFDAGAEAYAVGEYERALRYFRESHELSGRPELLFNIAQVAERLRRDEEALEAYRGFLADRPDAAQGPAVQRRIEFLEEQIRTEREEASQDADPSVVPEPTPEPERSPGWVGPIAVLVTSGVLAIAGAVMLGVALGERDRVENARDGVEWSEIEGSAGLVGPLSGVGIAALVVGGLGLAAGVVWVGAL